MYSFFGQTVKLDLKDSNYKNLLINELKPYKSSIKVHNISITDKWEKFSYKPISNNPKQHFYYKNIIHIQEKLTEVAFVFSNKSELTHIFFRLITAKSFLRKTARKWLNMQFTNRAENIGQIFHENILIPMSFFFKNVAPVHASGFQYKNKNYLIGGTGGVGKTTIELLFCLNKNAKFITDDIAIITDKSELFPNYNFPKIYGYNLKGNNILNKKLLKNSGFFNKIHWKIHHTFFGINKVRRKISPFKLYQYVQDKPAQLTDYLIFFRANVPKIEKKQIPINIAISATIDVILTEYAYFFNQLKWHEYNAIISNDKPIITLDKLQKKWSNILKYALQNSNNQIVKIPINIKHKDYLNKIEKVLID
jgi:hypothetical protein